MKKTLTALATALLFASAAYAVDEHHPQDQTAKPAVEQTVQRMQQNATKMQVQLDRIAQTSNSEERQKLLAEHMQTMRENMMLGHHMAKGEMDCAMMGSDSMMGGGGEPGTMMKRMQQLEHRMDMMEQKLGTAGKRPAQSK